MSVKTETRIRRCQKCANTCPLDNPKCPSGKAIAEAFGIYEEVPVEEPSLKQKLSALRTGIDSRKHY